MTMPHFPRLFILTLFAATLAFAADAPLRVGAASADITPLRGEHEMSGMNGNRAVVEKVHDPLGAKVVVFEHGDERVALVALDLIGFSDDAWDAIRAGIARDTGITQIICTVTHDHGSGFPAEAATAYIVERTLGAAREAHASLAPARIGHGRGELNEGYNRRIVNADGTVSMLWNNRDRRRTFPVDDELGVLSVRRLDDDRTIATLVNYSVHPVISMNFDELIVSGDYPAAMARKVEAAVGGECIFLLGAAGDINPYDADMFRYATPDEVFATIDRVSSNVANAVLAINQRLTTFRDNTPLAFDRYALPMASRRDGPHAEKTRDVELITFLIDQRFAMATIPGEPFVELGLDLKHRSPAESTWVIANAYSSSGYLPTLKATSEGGYGATSSTRLEVGAGERMIHQALVSIRHQMGLVKPLD